MQPDLRCDRQTDGMTDGLTSTTAYRPRPIPYRASMASRGNKLTVSFSFTRWSDYASLTLSIVVTAQTVTAFRRVLTELGYQKLPSSPLSLETNNIQKYCTDLHQIFTARCTTVQSAVLLSLAACLSNCLSVRLWKILETNCANN